MDILSPSPFNLHKILSMRCSINGPLFCQQCESCKLVEKVNLTKAWFIPLSFNVKRIFLERLILLSNDIIDKVPGILNCLQSKDHQYSSSRLKKSTNGNKERIHEKLDEITNHSLDMDEIETIINEQYISWYVNSSEWTKQNFLMALFKFCTINLICFIQQFVSELSADDVSTKQCVELVEPDIPNKIGMPDLSPQHFFDTGREARRLDRISKCRSAPVIRPKSAMKSTGSKKNRNFSARERITFKEDVNSKFYSNKDYKLFNDNLSSRVSSALSKTPSKAVFLPQCNSVARCTPILVSDKEDDAFSVFSDVDLTCSSKKIEGKDFIRLVPVQVSKKIFGYLNEEELITAAKVSQHWGYLADQVRMELSLRQTAKEDVMMMQPANAKVPHPCYARKVPVHVPRLNSKKELIINFEAKHVDVEVLYNEFTDINMEECYEGLETKQVLFEERNIFCSSYNVLVLDTRKDTHRRIHCMDGNLVAFGSFDRKIHLRDINTAENIRTIIGHSGSVKCLFLDERNKIVFSGGYDTTVRVWDITSGKCKFIFRGHKGTIIALSADDTTIVSVSTDSYIKVWNLQTGRCKRTILNDSVVRIIQVINGFLLTGCTEGIINLWHIESTSIIKTYTGHKASVTCVKYLKYHILSGSMDGFVKLWSNVDALTDCLKTYRHPREVLCLEVAYCRILTGCADGKIRVWNMLNGDCLRLIRGNSKNDAITSLFASDNRLVVNTESCVLVYHFEEVTWDHTAPRNRCDTSQTIKHNTPQKHQHSYNRAMKLQYNGSPIHKAQSKIFNTNSSLSQYPGCDTTRSNVNSRGPSSVNQHISRIKSAHEVISSQTMSKNDVTTIMHGDKKTKKSISDFKQIKFADDAPSCPKKHSDKTHNIKTRCRSAPAYRVMTLPPCERGMSTTAERTYDSPLKKMVLKPTALSTTKKTIVKDANPSRRISSFISSTKPTMADPVIGFTDLKIKTYQFQLAYEEELRKR